MAEQYWIGGFFVDVSRNQITHNKTAQTIPPKALAVLTYLAQRQGQVVSQEELMDNVWKDTIVSPNSLQRCIAQLRKAFGDDGKSQDFIKTHAKKGYSLETDIRWEQATAAKEDEVKSTPDTRTERPKNKWFVTACLFIAIFAGLITVLNTPRSSDDIVISDIRLLTSTDNRELASTYSPDGQYIVFQRFPEVLCTSNLWAKHVQTQEEFQLTQELGNYGNLSFSPDGNTLTFIEQNNCTPPAQQKDCFSLQRLDFAAALNSPQSPTTVVECTNTEIRNPIWLDSSTVALMRKANQRWQLIRYNIENDSTNNLHEVINGSVVSYDVSSSNREIAVTSVHSDNKLYIERVSSDGELLSSHVIEFPADIPEFTFISPNFSPIEDQLIFSTGKQLFTLNFEGEVSKVSLPLTDAIGTPEFHPDGQKMLAIKGHYDSDIVSIPFADLPNQFEQLNSNVIVRSMLEENRGKFQPSGNTVAFSSEGDGTSQVWLSDLSDSDSNSRPLSQFPVNTNVRNLLWSQSGESLLVNGSSQLFTLQLNGAIQPWASQHAVRDLYHWNESTNTVLANVRINGALKLAEVDLVNGSEEVLTDKPVKWAGKYNNQVIFMDSQGVFWQIGALEAAVIPALEGQGSDKRAVIKGKVIYSINDSFQLWSYNIDTLEFKVLAQLPDEVDYITDVNDSHILLTYRIAARKDVVELTLEQQK